MPKDEEVDNEIRDYWIGRVEKQNFKIIQMIIKGSMRKRNIENENSRLICWLNWMAKIKGTHFPDEELTGINFL